MKKQKVVIIGHSYTSRLGLIRSIASLNCDITIVAMVFRRRFGRIIRFRGGKPVDCYSKYVSRVLFCYADCEERLIKLLNERCADPSQKVILIPDSDFSAAAIDNNKGLLKEKFLFPNIKEYRESVEHWMDKTVQKELALRSGLNVAEGVVVEVKDGHYELPQILSYPCFTKPLATISGGKQFLKRCNNEMELVNVLDKVAGVFNTNVLVEDFKTIDIEYAVVGYSDGRQVVIPGIIQFLVNSKSHFGIAREGLIMPNCGLESLIEKFKLFVRNLGFCGLFDIDFYESKGVFYFGEINLRFGGSGYAYTVMGANLPAMMIRSFQGDKDGLCVSEVNRTSTFVNERMCLDDYLQGYISEKEMNDVIKKSNIHFIYDDNDKGPQVQFEKNMFIVRLKRLRHKLKRII